jgi:hypothetical protein
MRLRVGLDLLTNRKVHAFAGNQTLVLQPIASRFII